MSGSKPEIGPTSSPASELPAPGYPVSEEAVDRWFREHRGRAPTDLELGAILGAMADREATPPCDGPKSEPGGRSVPPVTRG